MIGYILNKGQLEATVRSLSGKRLRESEVIELKEAKNDFSFKDMTRYFFCSEQ